MTSLYESITQRIGFLFFISFAMVFISLPIEKHLTGLGLNPSEAIMANIPGLSVIVLLPIMFFGSCFLCLGITFFLPSKKMKKYGGIFGDIFALLIGLMGGAALLFGIYLSITYQPYYLFIFVIIIVFFLIPKGIFKTEKIESINFFPDKITITKKDGTTKTHYSKDIKMISLMENFNGLVVYTNTDSVTYETNIPYSKLKEGIETLGFTISEKLVQSAKGKPLEEIIGEQLDQKKYQFRVYKPFRDSVSREQYFIPRFNQWLEADAEYIFHIQYSNQSNPLNKLPIKINPLSFVKPVIWIGILLLVLYAGYLFIPHTTYTYTQQFYSQGNNFSKAYTLHLNDYLDLASKDNPSKILRMTVTSFGGKMTYPDGRDINCCGVTITSGQETITNTSACQYQQIFKEIFYDGIYANRIIYDDKNEQNSFIEIDFVKERRP